MQSGQQSEIRWEQGRRKRGAFCRFPNGESGADVYDRMTIFEDHLVRDINAGELLVPSSCLVVPYHCYCVNSMGSMPF